MAKTTATKTKPAESVDDFMANLEHPLKAEVEAVRQIILKADKGITERVKWNAPTFLYDGEDRITFHLRAKEGIQLIFHRGAKAKDNAGFRFEDPNGLLEWIADDRATVKLADMKDVKAKKKGLENVVKEWVERGG